MALTPQQIQELNVASERVAAGKPLPPSSNNAGDVANLKYAAQQGYKYTPTSVAPASTTIKTPAAPPQPFDAQGQQGIFSGLGNYGAFTSMMTYVQQGLNQNNDLVAQRNALVSAFGGGKPDPALLAKLTPDQQNAVINNDTQLLAQQIGLINNTISGRVNAVDTSAQYLTQNYKTAIDEAQSLYQKHFDNIMAAYNAGGSAAFANMPEAQKRQLERDNGLPSGFFDTKSINEIKAATAAGKPVLIRQQLAVGPDGKLTKYNVYAIPDAMAPNGYREELSPTPIIGNESIGSATGIISANGQYFDISSYATDPNHETSVATIMQGLGKLNTPDQIDPYIQSHTVGGKQSPITADMVRSAAKNYDIPWEPLMALMQQDSHFGTDGIAQSTMNPGNVGTDDSGNVHSYPSWQAGVDAVAEWLSRHRTTADAAQQASDTTGTNAEVIAKAIINGSQPPDLTRMYGQSVQVRAALAKMGYNLTRAQEDWAAMTKWIASANSTQQLRLRQAISFTSDSLNVLDKMNEAWKGSGFPLYNKADLIAAAQGVDNAPLKTPLTINVPTLDGTTVTETIKDKQSLATLFNTQIADLTSELGTVYKGGNTSTDESLSLAAKNLSADWSYSTMQSALQQARINLQYRKNSMSATGATGVSGDKNLYAPTGDTATPSSSATPPMSSSNNGSYEDYLKAIK